MNLTLFAVLLAAVVEDFKEMQISNRLIVFGLICGLTFRIFGEGSAGIVHFLLNISIPVILLFLLFQMRALGAGDIKLFSVAGGFLTAKQLLYLVAVSFLAAGIIGIAKLFYQKLVTGSFGNGRTLIHFSTAILIAYFIVVWGVPLSKILVAVCDTDEVYRERFVTYLVEHKLGLMEVHAFSVPEVFFEEKKRQKFDLVILGNGFDVAREAVEEQKIPLLLLRDNVPQQVAEQLGYATGKKEMPDVYGQSEEAECGGQEEEVRFASVFRYQPMEAILHEMQILTGTCLKGKALPDSAVAKVEMIGVYSPIRHEMQMPFALVLAEFLAEKKKVLYVNLMGNSGFLEIFGLEGGYDLGDVILRLRKKRISPEMFLRSVYEWKNFYYIPPFGNPENLKEMTQQDYLELLEFLAEQTDFETVVFDFGEGLSDFGTMLQQCTSIYCPVKNGYFFDCQTRSFLEYLKAQVGEELRERLQMIHLPFSARQIRGGSDVLRQLSWSEFGDYVRGVLTGGGQ